MNPIYLDQTFRQALYNHTHGHPLFTVEIVRSLQERGDLRQDEEGCWVASPDLLWNSLPARIEGVIERRIRRLVPELQEALAVASVEGEEFTAEVVAQVQGLNERDLVRRLSTELAKQHHLVIAQDIWRIDSHRLSRYQFQHNLFQKYLYSSLDEIERVYLHEMVGTTLEALYGQHREQIAVQLAWHFQAAQLNDKAIDYLQMAGEQATSRVAHQEAVQFYSDAWRLLKTLPETSERQAQGFSLHMAWGEAQFNVGQIIEALETFHRAADMAKLLDSPEDLARAALGCEYMRFRINLSANSVVVLLEEAHEALGTADSALKAKVLGNLARAYMAIGNSQHLDKLMEEAIAMARRVGDPIALFDILQIIFFTDLRPETIETRLTMVEEMLKLVPEIKDQARTIEAYAYSIQIYLEVGDIQTVDTGIETYAQVTQKTLNSFDMHLTLTQQALQAILRGHFAKGEKLAFEAFQMGQQLEMATTDGMFGIQMFTIRREQGGLQPLLPLIKNFVNSDSANAAWRPGLALILSDLGLEQETQSEFEHLMADNLASLPQDSFWVASLAYLSEVCAFLDDTKRAAILYQHLLPYAKLNIVAGFMVICLGAAARFLGILATLLKHWEEAEAHFKFALKMNERMKAWPWLAHTQYQYARMLLNRDNPGDRAQAVHLLSQVKTTVDELDLKFLAEKVEQLEKS